MNAPTTATGVVTVYYFLNFRVVGRQCVKTGGMLRTVTVAVVAAGAYLWPAAVWRSSVLVNGLWSLHC